MESKVILKVESKIDKFNFYFFNLILLFLLAYVLSVFKQNQILFSIFLGIIIFLAFLSGYSQIKVYNNKVEIIGKGFFRINTSIKTFYFEQINSIDVTLKLDRSQFITFELFSIFRPSFGLSSWNEFVIFLNDGNKKSFTSKIYSEDLVKVFELIKDESKNKIIITGLNKKIPLLE